MDIERDLKKNIKLIVYSPNLKQILREGKERGMMIENRMTQQERNGRSDEEWFQMAKEIKNALLQGTYFQK